MLHCKCKPEGEMHNRFVKLHAKVSIIYNVTISKCFPLLQELLKNVTQMEDQRSVEGHIRSMKNEMQNATPNIEKLHDSMERTFSARRQWIRDAHLSMHDILEQYPALEKPELVSFRCSLCLTVLLYSPASLSDFPWVWTYWWQVTVGDYHWGSTMSYWHSLAVGKKQSGTTHTGNTSNVAELEWGWQEM